MTVEELKQERDNLMKELQDLRQSATRCEGAIIFLNKKIEALEVAPKAEKKDAKNIQ